MRTSQVMDAIPDSAPLVFEFNNDKSFYEIFNGSPLFASVTGKQKLGELDTLRHVLLQNPAIDKYFSDQNIFISVHPSKTNDIDLLLTMPSINGFEGDLFEMIAKTPNSGLVVTPFRLEGKQGYNIYISAVKNAFLPG